MSQTGAAVQAVLGTNGMNAIIQAELPPYGTATQSWAVRSGVNAAGRTRNVTTTASDSAATQGAAILTALRA